MPCFSDVPVTIEGHTDVDFEVYCAKCNKGLCNQSEATVTFGRGELCVRVEPCDCEYEKGKEEGHEEGYEKAKKEWGTEKYEEGKQDGYDEGYEEGKQDGYDEGYNDAKEEISDD